MARRALGPMGAVVLSLLLLVPDGASSQGVNTIRLVLEGGPEAGTYELVTQDPCREGENGPGIWALYIDDTGAMPSRVSFSFGLESEWNQISATFGDSAAGGARYRSDFQDQGRATIDDRGDRVTLTLAIDAVHVHDPVQGRDVDVPARVTIECSITTRVNPVPSDMGPLTPPEPGRWTGTITLRAVIDHQENEEGSSGEPGSTYYQTFVRDDVTQESVTDALAITGTDPDDGSGGIGRVRLDGTGTLEGSTHQLSVVTWQKQNSGCTWTEVERTETDGSWSGSGTATGELVFDTDGSYFLDVFPQFDEPEPMTQYYTDTISDLSPGCEGEGYETDMPAGPLLPSASWLLGQADIDGVYIRLSGRLDAGDPRSEVTGSGTWYLEWPLVGTTLAAEWHLVHDGPILLPQP